MKYNKNVSKRIIVFDGCSIPFCVVWTKKYNAKEIKEIANYIFFLKQKIFTNKYVSKKLFCHICSSEYAKYFKILGISSWEISDEAIQKEYNFDLFNRKNSPEKFFEKYDIVETYKDYKEIDSEYFIEKYKELNFKELEKIFYDELKEELKSKNKPKDERMEIIRKELYYMNSEICDCITALGFLDGIVDKENFLEEIQNQFYKTSERFMQWYKIYFNIVTNRI